MKIRCLVTLIILAGCDDNATNESGLQQPDLAVPTVQDDPVMVTARTLDSPATTVALLELNAVVGVTGKFDGTGRLTSMGSRSPTRAEDRAA